MNNIKDFPIFFLSLTLHVANLLFWTKMFSHTLFKIITVSRPSTLLRMFLMGSQDFPLQGGLGGSELKPKIFNLPLLLNVSSYQTKLSPPIFIYISSSLSFEHRPDIGKKVSLRAFRQILPKSLLAMHIFSFTIMTYLKIFIWIKPLIQSSVQQHYLPELYPLYLPESKNLPLL